jgi:hypothetical protein
VVPGNPYERLAFLRPGGSSVGASEGRELPALNAASLLEATGLDGNMAASSVMAPKGEGQRCGWLLLGRRGVCCGAGVAGAAGGQHQSCRQLPPSGAHPRPRHPPATPGVDDTAPAFQRLRCALLSLPVHNGFAGGSSGAGDGRVLGVAWPPRAWTESGEPAPQPLPATGAAAERAGLEVLRGACLSELRGLATSAAQDEELLLASAAAKAGVGESRRALGARQEAAVRCRLEHKLLVEAALEALERYEAHLRQSARLAGAR